MPPPIAFAASYADYRAGVFKPWAQRLPHLPLFAVMFEGGRVFSARDGWSPSGPV